MKKSSMIESAQIILGGIKENSQSPKGPIQSWGAWKKIQMIQIFWAKKKSQCNDAQNQMKKTKRKSPSLTLGGTVDHFTNQIQGPEMYEQKSLGYKHWWYLVLKSLKHLLSLRISFSSWPIAQAYITCLIKPFLIKGKQSGSVGSAFSCETKSLFMQIK